MIKDNSSTILSAALLINVNDSVDLMSPHICSVARWESLLLMTMYGIYIVIMKYVERRTSVCMNRMYFLYKRHQQTRRLQVQRPDSSVCDASVQECQAVLRRIR